MPTNRIAAFRDGRWRRWSRVTLANGDRIRVSVARAGVAVKRLRAVLFGATLFREASPYHATRTAQELHARLGGYSTPAGMRNAVLKAFTQSVLGCGSAAEVAARLNEASVAAVLAEKVRPRPAPARLAAAPPGATPGSSALHVHRLPQPVA